MIPRLGKLPPRKDARTLKLASYMPAEVARAPDVVDYGIKVPAWPMYANDRIGDCAVVAPAYAIETWTANAGAIDIIPESSVLRAYSAISGWDGSPATDRGCVVLDVLRYWKRVGIGGHKIAGYVEVDHWDTWHVRHAMWMFGGVYAGIGLPLTAQSQNDLWSVVDPQLRGTSAPGSWGGHAVWHPTCDAGHLRPRTWGREQPESWAYWAAYVDECWAILSEDWIDKATQRAPPGFDFDALVADLERVSR